MLYARSSRVLTFSVLPTSKIGHTWSGFGFTQGEMAEKETVFAPFKPKLGTTCLWLLQCNRDLSQPSYAVELANLAAHA
jgi:hypothetical protein